MPKTPERLARRSANLARMSVRSDSVPTYLERINRYGEVVSAKYMGHRAINISPSHNFTSRGWSRLASNISHIDPGDGTVTNRDGNIAKQLIEAIQSALVPARRRDPVSHE